MAQTQTQIERSSSSVIDSLGVEIVKIVAPVSICMFLVVILVSTLDTNYSLEASVATIAYTETTSDSSWDKFLGALLNSLAFVVVVTVATFVLVLLFYFRCTRFLKLYMAFSAFVVLGFLGGEISLFLIQHFSTPVDCITFFLVLCNFAVVGVLAVFMSKMAILVTQGYLVIIGILVAYWFTMLPEWTTWAMLVTMALYDLAAVLLPIGPLRLLVELAISRDEEIPALVYEARPVNHGNLDPSDAVITQGRVWRDRRIENSNLLTDSDVNANSVLGQGLNADSHSNSDANNVSSSNPISNNPDDTNLVRENASSNSNLNSSTSNGTYSDRNLVRVEEGLVQETDSGLSAPLINHGMNVQPHGAEHAMSNENLMLEGIGLGSSGAIKLGLGDFIFYSVLVGRAAMYDYMTVYACYLAIIAGLGITLMLLALYQKALPALPVSIALGVLFYFLTRLLLEIFVVQCSLNLLMF
ncbi:presenilin-like protein At2g29900 isoform X1 [Gastrolobium bilobum]|uniref:presenilin-like protein At2g29900 isoform X1 n=1 Tax=Gastrolobium bilobum TaxID=150636 RepID=UPI002AB2FB7E|nr:presenilin-like protein At2g29900 isoform X1 [Gastrolobium bilobum]